MGQEYHDVDLSRTAPWNVDTRNKPNRMLKGEDAEKPVYLLLTWGAKSETSEKGVVVDSWNQISCSVLRDLEGRIQGIQINQRGIINTDTTAALEDVLDMAVQNPDRVQQVHDGEPFNYYDTYHHGRDVIQFMPKDELHPQVLTEEEMTRQEEANKRINEEIQRIPPPSEIFEGAMMPGPQQELAKKAWKEILDDNNRVAKRLHDLYKEERRRRTSEKQGKEIS